MLLNDLPQDFLLVVGGDSLGDVVLLGQFIVELKGIATIAVDLLSLLLAPLQRLLRLLVLVNLLLKSQQDLHIIQVV